MTAYDHSFNSGSETLSKNPDSVGIGVIRVGATLYILSLVVAVLTC